ncbi:MAG: prepilin-type N-terminal cleavage/methylation domain-containing protein [Longimicrobiales bacterium]
MSTEPLSRRRPGVSLVELVVVLTILSVISAAGALALRRGLEVYGTRGARDSMASAVARARSLALANGAALLVVDPVAASLWIEAPPGVRSGEPLRLGDVFGVTVSADHHDAGDGPITLEFDGLGFGRVASRTFRIRRGSTESRLTLSSYGRPRRW